MSKSLSLSKRGQRGGEETPIHPELVASVWEDVVAFSLSEEPNPHPSNSVSPQHIGIHTHRAKTQLHARSRSRRSPVKPRITRPIVRADAHQGVVTSGNLLRYASNVFIQAMGLLRYPFSILLALWILSLVLARIVDRVRTPFCHIPALSSMLACAAGDLKAPLWADYPSLMDVQRSSFEQLLDESVGGSELSLQVKKAEIATSDLVTLIKFSDLKSRDVMARMLQEFVSEAKLTGRGLQRLSSKIGGAVDSILAVNDHALHVIEAHISKSKSQLSIIRPFSRVLLSQVITRTFTDAMSVLSTQLERIVIEAQVSLANLDRLEERLVSLHELLQHENYHVSAERSELLAELWTMLGENRREVATLDDRRALLRDVSQYRSRALAHIVAALQTVQSMGEDIEDLRERVAAPEVVGERIPAEVHMNSIKAGLDRLSEKRYRAREREELAIEQILGRTE